MGSDRGSEQVCLGRWQVFGEPSFLVGDDAQRENHVLHSISLGVFLQSPVASPVDSPMTGQ